MRVKRCVSIFGAMVAMGAIIPAGSLSGISRMQAGDGNRDAEHGTSQGWPIDPADLSTHRSGL